MSVKKNIAWNMILTLSGYIFPLLTFPYVTRVLGAENLGIVNYTLSIIDYAVLFSTLGMSIVGVRYISQNGGDKEKRSQAFSGLVSLHLVLSLTVLAVYLACITFIPTLQNHKELYYAGSAKIIFNVMLIEWLFQGMQDFRYVTVRTLAIRCIHIAAVFALVRSKDDYDWYFYIMIAQVVVNAIVNWHYAQRYIKYRFTLQRKYLYPVMSMGLNMILLSFYTTFNVIYLGSICGNESVGYYTTATKLYGICLSVITAYNNVFVPHLNALYAAGEIEQFRSTITRSIHMVSMFALPVIFTATCLAPQIIRFIAGEGYERAILPFQIIMIQVLLVGLAQILENQILLAYKKFREILICTASTTTLAVAIIVFFVPTHAEVAAAWAVAIPHLFELGILYFYARKTIKFNISIHSIVRNIIICLPICIICNITAQVFDNTFAIITIGATAASAYYILMQLIVIKDASVIQICKNIFLVKKAPDA